MQIHTRQGDDMDEQLEHARHFFAKAQALAARQAESPMPPDDYDSASQSLFDELAENLGWTPPEKAAMWEKLHIDAPLLVARVSELIASGASLEQAAMIAQLERRQKAN